MGENHGWLLQAGDFLRVGDWLLCGDGPNGNTYAAVMQGNGDLLLCYATADGNPDPSRRYYSLIRDSAPGHMGNPNFYFNPAQTNGQYFTVMQMDGNVVMYTGPDPARLRQAYWATNTSILRNRGGYCLSLGRDGNLRLHDVAEAAADPTNPEVTPVLWQTALTYPAQRAARGNCLHTDQWLATGDYLTSANGRFAALLRDDGNLVLCSTGSNRTPDTSRIYWSAFDQGASRKVGTPAGAPYCAVLQTDENFVLYNGGRPPHAGDKPSPYWAISNVGRPATDSVAVLRDDGILAVLPGTDAAATVSPRFQTTGPPDVRTTMKVNWPTYAKAVVPITLTNLGTTPSAPGAMKIDVNLVQFFSNKMGAGPDCQITRDGEHSTTFVCQVPAIAAGATHTRELTLENLSHQAPRYAQARVTTTIPGDTDPSNNSGYTDITFRG
ncbi:hypothetical protein [Streptomyces sp. NBC_01304]|uniref:hypothetical protein n=1 Tax=Streptomyces sp. NBC_01304 TaxID=2903818 RepID=UPI002E14939C|nr:hypothetical protein OG430_02550 [Streptomyces sp. NBC_01304]